ncbi:MAG TPA: hypothetical protein PK472_03025 [Pseudomonadota bacterium]|nr:hypothetical protein [Pseudomonadota bacterium]
MPTLATPVTVRFTDQNGAAVSLEGVLLSVGETAAAELQGNQTSKGLHLLLSGDRDYYVMISQPLAPDTRLALSGQVGKSVSALFAGRPEVRRRLARLIESTQDPEAQPGTPAEGGPSPEASTQGAPINLQEGIFGAAPLFLLPEGRLSLSATDPVPTSIELTPVFVAAARWISSRRRSTFECLFPPSAFHPDLPVRPERLSVAQAGVLLVQLRDGLSAAAVGGEGANENPVEAVQLRSAALTILSHLVATVAKDPSFRTVADEAAEIIFSLIDEEKDDPTARPALRSHAIQLLQMRAPALSAAHRQRAQDLLRSLIRQAPPYTELPTVWRFAMCSAWDFHEGEVELLQKRFGFTKAEPEKNPPKLPFPVERYHVVQAPFHGPKGEPIYVYARTASPKDENTEMGSEAFVGVLINRHAQLGSFDMQASASDVHQVGYKLMMNSQCAGLTTRFAIAKMFPEADIYSSWDSTYFRTDPKSGKVTASEGLDCFAALLEGMSRGESHDDLSARIQQAQWHHEQGQRDGFVQFVGPAHPLVISRYSDVNQDGKADFYDGFLDFTLKNIQTDLQASATPRDPGVAASQIGGDAATGLNWAAGSLNRVTQYSDLWRGLPGDSELFYIFSSGGFYSHLEPPQDVAVGQGAQEVELGRLPAVCRYIQKSYGSADEPGLSVEVMFHSHLSHAAPELKRLLCAAEAMRRGLDLGMLPPEGPLATQLAQRGALLLLLAGLLEFPADQNFIDGLWSMALKLLNLPSISRSLVRGCITDADHNASNYYGSRRGLLQLLGDGTTDGALTKSDPLAYERLRSDDPSIGRAIPLKLS